MNRNTLLAGSLVVAFLVLAILLVTIPVFAVRIAITDTTLEDFNAGFLYHTGLTRFDDGEVQLMVVGLAGDWITDTNTTGLPALARHTAVYTNDHIIVLGGRDINDLPSDGVYYSTVDLYTHDLADWQATTPLPASIYPNGGLFWHASVIVHNRVYVLGGADTTNRYATVAFAPINSDGSLGAWQTTEPLPHALCLLQAVAVNDRIYVIGGWDSSSAARDEIYFAEPDPATGLISGWTQTANFAYPTFGHMAGVHEGNIYVMGGTHPTLFVSPYTNVTTPDPGTGQISGWTQLIDMENNIYGGAGLALNGVLFTTGGALNSIVNPSDYVGTALINLDGSINSWSNTSTIVPARFYHATVHSNDGWLYLINGSDGIHPIANINRGATTGVGEQHAPDGT
jgi:N-acetylneuraminic acid mutarotase